MITVFKNKNDIPQDMEYVELNDIYFNQNTALKLDDRAEKIIETYDKNYWYTSSSTNRFYMLFQVKNQDGMLDYHKIVIFDNLMVSGDGKISYEKSDVTTSYDYATYLEREKHGTGFSSYKENVGNIPSEIEYLDVPVLDVNVNEEKMFPVLDTLASNCYRYEYAPNNVEYFWRVLYTLISNNPDLGEYDSAGYGIVVERSMLEMYASGLLNRLQSLLV